MDTAVVLLFIYEMKDSDSPHEPGSEEYIGDLECTDLLTGIINVWFVS